MGYDPVAENPAAYVVAMRKRALQKMANNMDSLSDEDELEGMTKAEIRSYYDRKIRAKLATMDSREQQAMIVRYAVS